MLSLREAILWDKFEMTGTVADYLRYRGSLNASQEEYINAADNRWTDNKGTKERRG